MAGELYGDGGHEGISKAAGQCEKPAALPWGLKRCRHTWGLWGHRRGRRTGVRLRPPIASLGNGDPVRPRNHTPARHRAPNLILRAPSLSAVASNGRVTRDI